MINLCIPTLSRYDCLTDCINSALKGSVKPHSINVVDNGGKFREVFSDLFEDAAITPENSYFTVFTENVPIYVFQPVVNYGVGRSWNHFLHNALDDDIIIICNDDVVFHENTIELLVKAAEENPKEIFFTPDCYWEHYWSCFLQKKESLAIIGDYDSNIFSYFEDRDYKYRMKLKNYKPYIVKNCYYTHANNGSNTIKSFDEGQRIEFNERFRKTGEYFIKKWGGPPESEIYTTPFGI
jgi:GT2 family glycosyltransferase